jgi:hypothetical protein
VCSVWGPPTPSHLVSRCVGWGQQPGDPEDLLSREVTGGWGLLLGTWEELACSRSSYGVRSHSESDPG